MAGKSFLQALFEKYDDSGDTEFSNIILVPKGAPGRRGVFLLDLLGEGGNKHDDDGMKIMMITAMMMITMTAMIIIINSVTLFLNCNNHH